MRRRVELSEIGTLAEESAVGGVGIDGGICLKGEGERAVETLRIEGALAVVGQIAEGACVWIAAPGATGFETCLEKGMCVHDGALLLGSGVCLDGDFTEGPVKGTRRAGAKRRTAGEGFFVSRGLACRPGAKTSLPPLPAVRAFG